MYLVTTNFGMENAFNTMQITFFVIFGGVYVLNIVCGIINIIKKNKIIGILSIIIGVSPLVFLIMGYIINTMYVDTTLANDCTDKYIIVKDISSYKTIIISNETGKVLKEFNGAVAKAKEYYIIYPTEYYYNDARYIICDKDFNVLATSTENPDLINDNTILYKDENDNMNHIKSYIEGKFVERYKSSSSYIQVVYSENENSFFSDNIYTNLGIE